MASFEEARAFFSKPPPRRLGQARTEVRRQIRAGSRIHYMIMAFAAIEVAAFAVVGAVFVPMSPEAFSTSNLGLTGGVLSVAAVSVGFFVWAWLRLRRDQRVVLRGQPWEGTVRHTERKTVSRGESSVEVLEAAISFMEYDQERWSQVQFSIRNPRPKAEKGDPAIVLIHPHDRGKVAVWARNKFGYGETSKKSRHVD